MDIWSWVFDRSRTLRDEGERELANMIDDFPGLVCDDKLQEAEEMYQRALPLCRALGDKWLEVFFRHWRLQGHVLRNQNAKGLLPEALALLDFTHEEETKACPQRICSVQDLAACYGIQDHRGFREQRVQVANETLAQIDGSWPCYKCISSEKIFAYMDSHMFEEAETTLEETRKELQRHGKHLNDELILVRAAFLRKTGRLEEALKVAEEGHNWGGGEHFKRSKEMALTLIKSQMGKDTEALATCPPFDAAAMSASLYGDWTETQLLFLAKGQINNSRALRKDLHHIAVLFEAKGAYRRTVEQCVKVIELCLEAQEPYRAWRALELLEAARPHLAEDLGAEATAQGLREAIEALTTSLPQAASADWQGGNTFATETEEIQALEAAHAASPHDVDILLQLCALWQDCFDEDRAYDALATAYAANEGAKTQPYEEAYGRSFLSRHGAQAYAEAFPLVGAKGLKTLDANAVATRCAIYIQTFEHGEKELATSAAEAWHAADPAAAPPLEALVRMAMAQSDFAAVHTHTKALAAQMGDASVAARRLLTTATLAQDTAMIKDLAAKLSIPVDDQGRLPPEAQQTIEIWVERKRWGPSCIRATKIGPALARATANWLLDDRLLYGCEFAIEFDAEDLSGMKHLPKDQNGNPLARHKTQDTGAGPRS